MTPEDARKMFTTAQQDGYEVRLRDDYSGRYMCGVHTHAVVIDCGNHADARDLCALSGVTGTRTDSMGMGIIIY